MSAFEDDLKGLFATAPDAAGDDAFEAKVAKRVDRVEKLRALALQARYGGYALAGAAMVYAGNDVLHRLLPRFLKTDAVVQAITAPTHMVAAPTSFAVLPYFLVGAIMVIGVAAAAISYLGARE